MKRKLDRLREPIFLGPLLTLGVIVLTELLNVGVFALPTAILLLLPVAYVAFVGGLGTGLLCASIAALYALHFYSEPGSLLSYSRSDFLRLAGFAVTVFAIAAMIGSLRNAAGRSEAKVRGSEARLRGMMEAVPLGIAIISYREGGRIEELNQNLWRTFGYDSAEELQEVPLVELYDEPADRERVLELQSQDSLREHAVRFKRKDGSRFWSAISSVWHRGADGEEKTVLVVRDITDIRQAEAARREYEAFNASIVESALDSILAIDAAGVVLEFNPAAETTFGYTREYAVGREMGELIVPPSLREAHRRGLQRHIDTGESRILDQQIELTAMRADGSEFPAEIAITRIADGGRPRFTGYVRDITRRKEAEDHLRSSEERFRLLIEGVQDYGIFMLDPDGRVASWNKGAERLKGYAEEEILGRHFSIFYREEDSQSPERILEAAIIEGRVENEGWRVRKDGSKFWANVVITALTDEDGELRGFSKITRDITERRRAEDALRASERRLAEAQRIARIGNWDYDVAADEAYWSDELYRIFGFEPQEFVPDYKTFLRLVHPEDTAILRRAVRQAAGGTPRSSIEYRVVRPDGEIVVVSTEYEPILDGSGRMVRLIGTIQNVTERRRAEEQLRQHAEELDRANRELKSKNEENEMFVYSVSHDLRSPLVNLEGFSQELSIVSRELRSLIEESDLPAETKARGLELVDEEMGESLYFIRNGVGRLSNIIDALLRLSRAGRVEYNWQSVDVDSTVSRVVDSMRETMEERGASVKIGQLPPAWGDAAALEQVFANLVGNAFKYLDPERTGLVEVAGEVEPEGGTVLYHVRDNGLGMPEHAKTKVFQVFQRAHPDAAEGEGVGLALVRRAAERHGGSVWVESVQGAGSTFFVRLRTAPETQGA